MVGGGGGNIPIEPLCRVVGSRVSVPTLSLVDSDLAVSPPSGRRGM